MRTIGAALATAIPCLLMLWGCGPGGAQLELDGGRSDDGGVLSDGGAGHDAGTSSDGGSTQDGGAVGDGGGPTPTCPTPGALDEVVDWATFFGVPWPAPGYSNVMNTVIPDPGALAIRFSTGTLQGQGLLLTVGNTSTTGIRFGSVSRCPGEVHGNLPADCTHAWGIGGSIAWSTEVTPAPRTCVLESDTTYYFNITFVGADGVSTCDALYGTKCTTTVQVVYRAG